MPQIRDTTADMQDPDGLDLLLLLASGSPEEFILGQERAGQTEPPRLILQAVGDQFELRCPAHDNGEQILGTWPLPVYDAPEAELRAAADAHNRDHHAAEPQQQPHHGPHKGQGDDTDAAATPGKTRPENAAQRRAEDEGGT
jgi:hypothetical protein